VSTESPVTVLVPVDDAAFDTDVPDVGALDAPELDVPELDVPEPEVVPPVFGPVVATAAGIDAVEVWVLKFSNMTRPATVPKSASATRFMGVVLS
jgi:hypothetical protein